LNLKKITPPPKKKTNNETGQFENFDASKPHFVGGVHFAVQFFQGGVIS